MKLEIDKELIIRRFGASFESYDRLADVQRRICERLASLVGGEPRRILEIGAGTGFLTRLLVEKWGSGRFVAGDSTPASQALNDVRQEWFMNDLSPASEGFVRAILPSAHFICGDAEAIEFPENLDLIASASTMQWFEDAAAFLAKAATALAPQGVLAVSTFGPENFRELRPAGLEYLSISELTALMERAGLVVEHAEEWTETLSFDEPLLLLKYIKTLGLNALPITTSIRGFNETRLTYHPIVVVVRRG